MRRVAAIAVLLALLLLAALLAVRPGEPGEFPTRPGGSPTDRAAEPSLVPTPTPDPERYRSDESENPEPTHDPRLPWKIVAGRSGTVPEALLGKGKCSLFLRLFDARTKTPVGRAPPLPRPSTPRRDKPATVATPR